MERDLPPTAEPGPESTERRIRPREDDQLEPAILMGDDDDAQYGNDRGERNPGAIRAEDTEPYVALQNVARLFKIAAMVVAVALVAEIVAGVALEGTGAILPLLAELIRGVVLAAILWGTGDLVMLLIDVGHDVRAARVLLGRISARGIDDPAAPGEPR